MNDQKFCSKCGKKIPAQSAFCPYCGQKQVTSQVNHVNFRQTSKPMTHGAPPALTATDIEMLVVNGISAFLQFIYSIQVLIKSLNSTVAIYACFIVAIFGALFSGVDGWENWRNRLPFLCPFLGVLGNLMGPLLTYFTGFTVICVSGTLILGLSFYVICKELNRKY